MIARVRESTGFTLIELLTVIAIIGILAAFLAVGLPRALEAARMSRLDNAFLQIRNILTEYYVDHGSFPPAYGYVSPAMRGSTPEVISQLLVSEDLLPKEVYFLRPWMDFLGQHNNRDLYDEFSEAYDTDGDGDISRLEFSPVGRKKAGEERFKFKMQLYDPDDVHAVLQNDLAEQFDGDQRPIIYMPVNKRQFRKIAAFWERENVNDPRPDDGTPSNINTALQAASFPPPNYDAYVLISGGPSASTWGMIYDFADGLLKKSAYTDRDPYFYHILGMATYFMATRDTDDGGAGDGFLDFDFRARTRQGQAGHDLPNKGASQAAGPLIFVGEG